MVTPRKPLPDHANAAVEDAQADIHSAQGDVDWVLARSLPVDIEARLARAARKMERALRRLEGIKRG